VLLRIDPPARTKPSSRLMKWASSSLLGHVVLCGTAWAGPMALLGMGLNYYDGTLTVGWALQITLGCILGGMVLGVVLWFTLTVPLAKSRERRR